MTETETHISDGTARRLASENHDGQASALYALSSSGAIRPEVADEIAQTIRDARRGVVLGMYNEATRDQWIAELKTLAAYVLRSGSRGPVEGWADVWED